MVKQSKDIKEAAWILQQGRVVAFPTRSSYGLAADALQGFALQRVRNMKKRPAEKTFSVFMRDALFPLFLKLTSAERDFLAAHKNSLLTLLVEPTEELSHLAQDGRVALRVIDHPLMQSLADTLDVPLTATSANIAGVEPCYSPAEIQKAFPGKLDETTYDLSLGLILDGGTLPKKEPSTIARLDGDKVIVVRKGPLTF